MSKSKTNALLAQATQIGQVSAESAAKIDVVDIGNQIQAGLGVVADDIAASEVVLLSMMPDDSQSIANSGNTDAVLQGHNEVLSSLRASKQADEVLVHTRYLNGDVLFPYTTLDNAIEMSRQNYFPILATPLYDQTMVMLGTVVAKTAELYQAGIAVRTVTLIITDGCDAGSRKAKVSDVKRLVTELLAQERHTVAAMGIDDGMTDFRAIFRDMGIPDRWILTPKNSPSEIRRAFAVFSQSVARTSGGFASAGFGN